VEVIMVFPQFVRLKQELEGPAIPDVAAEVHRKISSLPLRQKIQPGQTIAITAGSRGITGIDRIILSVVRECKALGLKPFIVPAMGSHGGATAEGQRHLLEHYGITSATMECEVRSSMEVVRVGEVKGIPVFCDRNAWSADYIAVVGRVKPHTDFDNEIESGLFKMMSIGLGKQQGAETYHRAGHQYGYAEVFPLVGKALLEKGKVLFGLPIVENGYGRTARIEAVLPPDFYDTEKELLALAKSWLGRLPFDDIDLLIVDEMGKNVSGTGMDPNVIGRACIQKHPDRPKVRQLLIRDLTPESDGNALGIGMADLTTKRLVDKISRTTTNINVITTGALDLAKIPMYFESDKDAVTTALGMIGLTPPEQARVVRIKNTLHLTAMDVSVPLLGEAALNRRLSPVGIAAPLSFDIDGNLKPF
jgi:hypothetical protein